MRLVSLRLSGVTIFCLLSAIVFAQSTSSDKTENSDVEEASDGRLAKGIQDNSFLIEEAYNQELGVVQSFGTFRGQGRDRFLAFTQEIPLGGQQHQLSYLLPYAFLRSESQRARGFGDLVVSYRYQALFENSSTPAFAPRISLIVPSGNSSKGTGNGSFGFQGNLPLSKIVTDRVSLHANAGVTSLLDVEGRRPTSLNVGGSAVYAVTRDFNILLETIGERIETVNATRGIDRQYALTISPGARYAFNMPDTQIVVGVAAPVTLDRDRRPNFGAIFYLSVESKLFR